MGALKTWLSLLACITWAATSAAAEPTLRAVRVKSSGPILNVAASFWKQAKPVAVPILPQTVATPIHPDNAVKELQARAVHNGQWLALLLTWKDPTRDDRIVTDEFGDQVAVEFPIEYNPDRLPSPMMGNAGGRVNIVQWRAAFQRDMEQGEPEVKALYPNAVVDLYPDYVLRATDARPYMGALGVDNPISRPTLSPVLDQMAEGWGTLTVKPDQHADGRGVWRDGRWTVVITLPMATESPNSPRLAPGGRTMVAFAVWEGGRREVGARKGWSAWVPLQLAR